MEKEIEFFDIPETDNNYSISKCGLVKSNKTEKILKPILRPTGYYSVNIYINKRLFTVRVHRLLCITFKPNPENKKCVNHINAITTDNRLENLEWATHSENNRHAYKIGTNSNKGSKNPAARKIIDLNSGFVFDCIKDAAYALNINYNSLKTTIGNPHVKLKHSGRFIYL